MRRGLCRFAAVGLASSRRASSLKKSVRGISAVGSSSGSSGVMDGRRKISTRSAGMSNMGVTVAFRNAQNTKMGLSSIKVSQAVGSTSPMISKSSYATIQIGAAPIRYITINSERIYNVQYDLTK
eukprot:TRINITY_DN1317_c0_g1_i2.p1 TRINITY_DN1317_c0_g1~~TRINITY_DN1317_c0_g1_i2.p1  ORF type:complete len:125 (+),score=1.17 TRINITY_DN1317_c0_g1_i2:95-469(+)